MQLLFTPGKLVTKDFKPCCNTKSTFVSNHLKEVFQVSMKRPGITNKPDVDVNSGEYVIGEGSKIAVIGGGPAGSFFSHFILEMADMMEL